MMTRSRNTSVSYLELGRGLLDLNCEAMSSNFNLITIAYCNRNFATKEQLDPNCEAMSCELSVSKKRVYKVQKGKIGELKVRLDKFLAHVTGNSRSDVKSFLKKKVVQVDGEVVTSAGFHVDPDQHVVTLFEDELFYQKHVYIMMNKPQGYLSATKDGQDQTVMALLDPYYHRFDISIAGRLDKDTEGLLILTNDGQFLHDVITPKKKVYKRYIAHIEGDLTTESIVSLERGVEIQDGKGALFVTQPARIKVINESQVEIEICEGKFHQVRRMFAHVGCKVVYLKRLAIGGLELDPYLELGECRELTDLECLQIK